MIGLLTADAANQTAHLGKQPWFLALMGFSILLIVIGMWGFFAHYKWRIIPLVLFAATIAAFLLHAPVLVAGAVAVAALIAFLLTMTPSEGPPWTGLMKQAVHEATIGGENAALRQQLDAAVQQRDAAQQQRDSAQRALDQQASLAKSLHDQLRDANARWAKIAPLVDAYRQTVDAANGLTAFLVEIEANMPPRGPLPSGKVSEQFAKVWEVGVGKNKQAYDERYRRPLVRLVTDLKTRFGLVSPALADDKIALDDVVFENSIVPMRDALTVFAERLKTMIADAAIYA